HLYLLNPDSSVPEYVQSLERLAAAAGAFDRLYTSHGPSPIDPAVIPDMLAGMREIARGRGPDRVERNPSIDGGAASVTSRREIRCHELGGCEGLRSPAARP